MTNGPFIVAEIGANHNRDYDTAAAMVESAKRAGADGVKLQNYTPAEIAADVRIESGPWAGRSYHDLYSKGMLPWEWHEPLFELVRRI